jgi:hypothetical protein
MLGSLLEGFEGWRGHLLMDPLYNTSIIVVNYDIVHWGVWRLDLDRMLLVHDGGWLMWLMWLGGSYDWDLLSFLRGRSLCTKPQRCLCSHLLATSCRR